MSFYSAPSCLTVTKKKLTRLQRPRKLLYVTLLATLLHVYVTNDIADKILKDKKNKQTLKE